MTTTAAAAATTDDEIAFEPILLTANGYMLEAEKQRGPQPITDESPLPQPGDVIGVHSFCEGLFFVHRATQWTNAGVCRKCGFRFEYAMVLKTYKALRRNFEFNT